MSNFPRVEFDSVRAAAGLRRALRAALRDARRLLPQRCALCNAGCGAALLCAACEQALPRIVSACPRCALPVASPVVCGDCLAHPPPYCAAIAACIYAFPVDRLVHAFKYGGQLALAEPLAAALIDAVARRARPPPDAVVALPLAPSRQRERGFNQAGEIARHVAAAIGRPQLAGLERTRDSPPQATLAWTERTRNVRGAFLACPCVAGRRIAIVDDVMTTGATLGAAAQAARRAGALDVEAWVVARTLPPGAP